MFFVFFVMTVSVVFKIARHGLNHFRSAILVALVVPTVINIVAKTFVRHLITREWVVIRLFQEVVNTIGAVVFDVVVQAIKKVFVFFFAVVMGLFPLVD